MEGSWWRPEVGGGERGRRRRRRRRLGREEGLVVGGRGRGERRFPSSVSAD
uniref:Uncharacterized protein n=1 Tax=Arundo donax TaxID=35708 RepID=A0A0A9EPI0_ARUDO